MRFRSRQDRVPYLNLKDQKRMLRLVGLLVLVIIAVNVASRPGFWALLFSNAPAERPAETSAGSAPSKPLDYRVRLDEEPELPPGVFRVPPSKSPPAGLPGGESPASSAEDVRIDPALLKPVRDNVIGIRNDEREALYTMLARARDLPPHVLEAAAEKNVPYSVLYSESEAFRGKLITVQGEVRKLFPFKAAQNDQGIDQLYEAWILTPDSGRDPYRVVCTSLPPGIPTGDRIDETVNVRVTGYFLKREAYSTAQGMHVAPLLLARELRWNRPQAGESSASPANPLVPVIIVGSIVLAGLLGLTVWRFGASDRQFYESHLKRITAAPQESIDALQNLPTSNLNEFFDDLRKSEGEADKT